jgi:bifunctional N-acetylglucosamine-1-phosphate-uridyltransferase/glucosamine-1-phosphate-acetyltransferase GlmU-like protein
VTLRGLGMPQDHQDPGEWARLEVQRLKTIESDVRTCCEKDEEIPAALTRLRAQAKDGEKYRTDSIEAALAEGVRAHGADFAKDRYTAVLQRSSLDEIHGMRDDWKATADKALASDGGRKVKEGEEPEGPKSIERQPPAHAYS